MAERMNQWVKGIWMKEWMNVWMNEWGANSWFGMKLKSNWNGIGMESNGMEWMKWMVMKWNEMQWDEVNESMNEWAHERNDEGMKQPMTQWLSEQSMNEWNMAKQAMKGWNKTKQSDMKWNANQMLRNAMTWNDMM